ncbi:hypothetical protein [Luteococcus japonicus]|uniref:Uncharacterized protein n=1 Tax=Luteococcus japonicus LSP_Lj1 TaxID=1255658 RepID=A0A1R4KKI1_9ACTN|nr:hypothetical protein [Luteococcus japonicus]SJN44725.1 hypothetical protein FM114_15345 [Luteococcus japonicus LSP_Lj1]
MTERTLSLNQVAQVCHVQRPVVSMWRKRPLHGSPFPAPQASGRFDADEVISWLEATGRGNNPQPRLDVALQTAVSRDASRAEVEALATLLAARSLLPGILSHMDAEELLDAVEEADADDEWGWSELQTIDDIEALAARADALVEAAWTPADAHDRLVRAQELQDPGKPRLAQSIVDLLSAASRALLAEDGEIVDVDGSAIDVVVHLLRDEDLPAPRVVLPGASAGTRRAHQRLIARRIPPRTPSEEEAWQLADGSVVLAHLPTDPSAALDALDALSVELAPGTRALVVGPAQILVDELDQLTSRRDALLREELLRAAVRLPQGLLADGARGHLGLWLMERGAGNRPHVGDLSGEPLTPVRAQQLLDDLVAVAFDDRRRAVELLHPVALPSLLARSTSLTTLETTIPVVLPGIPGDDAARIQQLLDQLAVPLPNPSKGLAARVAPGRDPSLVTLGDLARRRTIKVVSGTRLDMAALPDGSSRLWTAESLKSRRTVGVDLFQLTRQAPNAAVTKPGDVVFCSQGKPAASVDEVGGAVVAYPARVIRVSPTAAFSPRAIAAVINDLPAGSAAWRTWQVPVAKDRRATDDTLEVLDRFEQHLRDRQNVVDELRRVVMRSVPCGAVLVTSTNDEKEAQ